MTRRRPTVWSSPTVLAPEGDALRVSAVQTEGGQTIAAWAGNTGVFAATAGADRRFGRPQRLSRRPIDNDAAQILAVDRRGDAVVMWQQEYSGNPSPGSLFVSYRPAHGRFGPVHRIARDVGGAAIGIDAHGDATIVWGQLGRGRRVSLDVVERRSGGRYGPVQVLARGAVGLGAVAVNGRDQAVVVWASGALPSAAVFAATRRAHGRFSAPVQLVSAQEGAWPEAAGLDAHAVATIAWEGPYDGATAGIPFEHVEIASLTVGASASGPIQVIQTLGLGQLGDLGLVLQEDSRGDAIAVWQNLTRDGNTVKLVVARRRGGQPFGPARPAGDSYPGGSFAAGLGPTGQAIVSWDGLTAPVQAVIAASPSRAFGRAMRVAPRRQNSAAPAVTIDGRGRATAVWWDLGPSDPNAPSSPTALQYATTG